MGAARRDRHGRSSQQGSFAPRGSSVVGPPLGLERPPRLTSLACENGVNRAWQSATGRMKPQETE